jgi:hypothetical protein
VSETSTAEDQNVYSKGQQVEASDGYEAGNRVLKEVNLDDSEKPKSGTNVLSVRDMLCG